MIKNGRIPLWNPFFYCGQPLFASLQPGIIYPFNILLILFPFSFAFNSIIILHFFLAGYFTYLFIKNLNGSDTGALIGAIIFMLSGYLISIHNLLPHLLSVVWLPLILLFFLQYLRKGNFQYLLCTALFLVIMFLGGAVEIVYGTFLILLFLLFFPDPFVIHKDRIIIPLKKRGLSLGLIILLFILISAIQLLPFLELAFNSIREKGLEYEEAITWSMDSKDIVQFFIPDPYGYFSSTEKYWHNQSWLKTIYLGIIPFALALFFFMEKRKRALPLLLLMEIFLLFSFGGHTLLYRLLFHVLPFLNTIRYPVKFLFGVIFLISVAAGLGYDSFSKMCNEGSKGIKMIVRLFLLLSLITVCSWSIMSFYSTPIKKYMDIKGLTPPEYNAIDINFHNTKRFLLFCSFFGPVLILGLGCDKKKQTFSVALIALLTIDLFFVNKGYYHTYDSQKYHEPSQSINFFKKDPSLFRIITAPKTDRGSLPQSEVFSDPIKTSKEKIIPGFNIEHGIYSIGGCEVIRLKNYEKVLELILSSPKPDSTNLLALLNVKYILSKYDYPSNELELVDVIGDRSDPNGTLKIYKNLKCLPRAFLLEKSKILSSENEYKTILQSKEFSPAEVVYLDKVPFISTPKNQNIMKEMNIKDELSIEKYLPNRVELQVSVQTPKILFLSDAYYPGWMVYIDGIKGTIYRANFAFRAVPIPPGHHSVTFLYRPWSVIIGSIITLMSIIMVTILFIFPFNWSDSAHKQNSINQNAHDTNGQI